jgi:UDP-N-acetylglucosamine:LPS N-acetylglucosamine transferase
MGGVTVRRALFLSGQFGAGHDTLAEACADALLPYGVESKIIDCMPMLGGGPSAVGNWVFRRLLSMAPVYDGFHFSQLRGYGPVGRFMDRAAVKVMLPHLVEEVDRYAPDLLVSVFATGASAAVHLRPHHPDLATVVFMTDSFAHGMWAHRGTDLFLVTSELAAASVRSYVPDARVRVVEAPVRPSFYGAPSQGEARVSLGVPAEVGCVLLMSGAWGIGPLDEVARALAAEGWWVLAVSGTNERLAARLATVAREHPSVLAFGFTDRVPEMMAASDVVLTSSGDTCREARVIGRPLVLLDVVPGHGRENLMHELELGDAAVCRPTPASVVGNVRRFLGDRPGTVAGETTDWGRGFIDELVAAGIALDQD